jgi:hypothetical protein
MNQWHEAVYEPSERMSFELVWALVSASRTQVWLPATRDLYWEKKNDPE